MGLGMKFSGEGFMKEKEFLFEKGAFRCLKGYFKQGLNHNTRMCRDPETGTIQIRRIETIQIRNDSRLQSLNAQNDM
jgi:hypothetical protein